MKHLVINVKLISQLTALWAVPRCRLVYPTHNAWQDLVSSCSIAGWEKPGFQDGGGFQTNNSLGSKQGASIFNTGAVRCSGLIPVVMKYPSLSLNIRDISCKNYVFLLTVPCCRIDK